MKKLISLFVSITIILILGCSGTKQESSQGQLKLLPPPNDAIYFAAFPDFGGTEDEVSAQKIEKFNTLIGKKIAWACFSDNWYNGIEYPRDIIHTIYETGTIPYVRIMPRSDEIQGHAETLFSLANIIQGDFDEELRAWARDAKEDNIPLLVDFAVEANGDWFPWSGYFNGGSTPDGYGDESYADGPERYRDAYRHIIDLFRTQGVSNITWFFHYNYASFPNEAWNQPRNYYPGDTYIDWIGFSLYGAQTTSEEWEGLEFSTQLKDFYSSFKDLNSTKPVALLEFGVTDDHPDGNKSVWLNDAFATILDNDYVTFSAISPWHENWENEDGTMTLIRLDSSATTLTTFKNNITNSRFTNHLEFQK